MSRPRMVCLFTRFPWPLDRGDRLRAYNQVVQFSRHADVTLVTFCEGPAETQRLGDLEPYCHRIEVVQLPRVESLLAAARGVPGRQPLQVSFYRSEIMSRLCDRLAGEKFDFAFAYIFRMLPYLEQFRQSRRLLDLCDSLAMNLRRALPHKPAWLRPVIAEEMRRVERYERHALEAVEECWVVAEEDRRDFMARAPGARVEIVPNGVVTTWGTAGLEGPKDEAALFLGNLTVHHNVDTAEYLAREIWPRVMERRPGALLRFAGAYGHRVARLAGRPGIQLLGFVEDLAPVLRGARLAVAPLRYGSGIQNKVLETMAAGLPAVVTPIVSAPIGAEPGREIVVADSAGEVAAAIVDLLDHEARARSIGAAGSAFVRSRFSWDRAGERLRELIG